MHSPLEYNNYSVIFPYTIFYGSNITTNACGENVIGGNINIDADVLAAENSDISANSTDSRGGRVQIKTQGIFGAQIGIASPNSSDITARGANLYISNSLSVDGLPIN